MKNKNIILKRISLLIILSSLLFLISCMNSSKEDFMIGLSNSTCIKRNSTYIDFEYPVTVKNYYTINCLSNDRRLVQSYYFTQEEIEGMYKTYENQRNT